ncbi:lanC-like protein 3 homolog [Drosophila miranda]|uniref:lanC-like protein 3 homolog n=1 Tax=Drosophila miranda TaxID=7229 RepID=UPI0007E77EF7|nr:lanC-like protein 3 homolog [Drosophila miranda]
MGKDYLRNPYQDTAEVGESGLVLPWDEKLIKELISSYVKSILEQCKPRREDCGDLYVGNAGIAFMFWKLSRSEHGRDLCPTALQHASMFIRQAKREAERFKEHSSLPSYSFLRGNAGIYAVSAAISKALKDPKQLAKDLANFKAAIPSGKDDGGSDSMLVGRAGYLSGCYWLNDILPGKKIPDEDLISVCKIIIASGREYSTKNNSYLPLMYEYHGMEYLGAAQGLCGILQVLLDSPWFRKDHSQASESPLLDISAPADVLHDVKRTLDCVLTQQDVDGNFPVTLEDEGEKRLVQWCHGTPGIVYLMAKAYLIFMEPKYLRALVRSADFVWRKGFVRKGPGICHGVAGNGYVFLLLFRLTNQRIYLYRAYKFIELMTSEEFKQKARVPDRPHSLYEGLAGTVCFLVDLLEPEKAHFPFMDVFHYEK